MNEAFRPSQDLFVIKAVMVLPEDTLIPVGIFIIPGHIPSITKSQEVYSGVSGSGANLLITTTSFIVPRSYLSKSALLGGEAG